MSLSGLPIGCLRRRPTSSLASSPRSGQPCPTGTVGEDVFALSSFDRDGAAAEYVLVRGDNLARKPHSLGYVEAAAVPLAALSAWQGLFEHGQLVRGER